MIFYHGTSEEAWEKIQSEGVLWGMPEPNCTTEIIERYTYLTPKIEIAQGIGRGSVILEVEYEPRGIGVKDKDGNAYDNYGFDPPPGMICWQFAVFFPISLNKIRRIK